MASNVLLLNITYQPISQIDVKQAFNLLLVEKAEAVEGLSAILRSVKQEFKVPSVIKLTYYANVPHRTVRWSRPNILKRDGWVCGYCGIKYGASIDGITLTKKAFTIDHIVPKSKGGKDTWGNTICCCHPCNQKKGDKSYHEVGFKLQWEPKRPRTNTVVIGSNIPHEWKKYLQL